MYLIRFRSRAKEEFTRAGNYGAEFREELSIWAIDIARSAHSRDGRESIDVYRLLEEGAGRATSEKPWKYLWRKWWQATPITKVLALLAALKRRQSPWELRTTARWFDRILGAFDCEVHAWYEVDHVEKTVIFVKFEGLPGEG